MSRKSVREVSILATEKRRFPNKHYVYVIQVTWSTGATNKIYRRYSQLFEFQLTLIAQFPVQGGKRNPEDRTIPFLPGKKLFGRSHVREVAEERLVPITEYIQALIDLPAEVSASQIVTNFFEPTDEDIKPIREKQKRTVRENEAHEISDPILLEQWIVIGDFEKGKRTECTLREGDVVDVIEKKASGWWFVDNGGNKGWVPASYLESLAGKNENEVERFAPGEEEEYITTNSYIAQSPDELGFERGVVVIVLQKSYDGWWLCRYQRKDGLIPAAYLEPNTQDIDKQERENKFNATLPVSASSNSIASVKPDYSKSVKHNYKSIDIKPGQPAVPAVGTRQFIPRRESVRQTSIRKRKERESLGSFDNRVPEGRLDLFVAIMEYEATEPDGLSFKEGDAIEVIDKQDTGWWRGSLGGREGWVPSAYLESSVATQERSGRNKRCTAKERFNGNMRDTISFGVGEVFEIIEKSETGWWYVQNSSGQEGWAPQDLLEEGVNTKPKKQAPPSPTKPLPQSSTFDHLNSVSNKPSTIATSKSFNSDLKPVTPNKPIQQDKPVFQNKQVIKPDKPALSVRPGTNSKPLAPEKPVLPNPGTQNNNRPINIGSLGTDKPITPGKPSYSKVKIGVSGVESDKPSLPSRPRPNLTETQTPPSNNKPQVTPKPKPKPENGNVQNELASMLSKRLQTSSKPSLPISNKPNRVSRPISQEIGTVKPMLAAQSKTSEPSKPSLPSRPGRPAAPTNNNNNNTNNTNNNSTSSKYITIDINRAYDEGCLSFRKGETAELIEKGEDGWWWMRIRKDVGWVAKDKVKLERGAPPLPKGAGVCPVALEDFRAEYAESVSLKKGDTIQIIERDSGSGWTWVRVGKVEGWIPTDIISSC